jgi:septal ring factor EnvC (AmiA/AmiB activator)
MEHYKISLSRSPTLIAINSAMPSRNRRLAEGRSAPFSGAGRDTPRKSGILKTAAFVATAFLCLSPAAAQKKTNTASAPEIAERQADLGELRGRIETLRKELNASEENRADAASRLRESERQISRLQRELHQLAEQRGKLQRNLQALEQQSNELGGTLNQQQQQLERLLYKQHLRSTPDSLQMLLNGDDPNQMARDLHYLSAIAQSRAELMNEISRTLAKKKSLAADARERSAELAEVETAQQQRAAELKQQRDERKALHAEISSKVKAQRQEIGNLQRDEKRLTQLIDRLSKILAAQAAQAARAEAARARAAEAVRQQAQKDVERPPAPAVGTAPPRTKEAENRYEPAPSDGSFARQKGKLRLPVRGTVAGRFGAPREGGGTWRGLFIRSAAGSEVKAIANGRVVFAEWMRGFGNLLIVDHGNAYLSIYGNNDSLLKQVGDAVKGGETVAAVGNSGGNPESGLYFELRHQGQPIDPMKWASPK